MDIVMPKDTLAAENIILRVSKKLEPPEDAFGRSTFDLEIWRNHDEFVNVESEIIKDVCCSKLFNFSA